MRNWLLVVAGRIAIDLQRQRSHAPLSDGEEQARDPEGPPIDPELDYLKRKYRRDFEEAFASALAFLPEAQRDLLHLNVVEGLNIDAIGQRKNVHRATAARWIAVARRAVLTRRASGWSNRCALGERSSTASPGSCAVR